MTFLTLEPSDTSSGAGTHLCTCTKRVNMEQNSTTELTGEFSCDFSAIYSDILKYRTVVVEGKERILF